MFKQLILITQILILIKKYYWLYAGAEGACRRERIRRQHEVTNKIDSLTTTYVCSNNNIK